LNTSVLSRYSTALILLLAILIRIPISFISYQGAVSAPNIYESRLVNNTDALDYLRLAENLVEGRGYSIAGEAPYEPDLKRVPGYPVFLSALYLLAGKQHSPLLILAANLGFALLNIWLIIQIGKLLFSPNVGALAALIYALAPISIALANQAMSETLFTCLLLLSLYFVLRWELKTWWRLIIGAIVLAVLLALTTYVRAIATYVLPLYLLYWILRAFNLKKALVLLSVSFSVFVLLLLPWYIRNHNTFGVYTFSSVSDGNLLTYNAASVYATEQGIGLRPAKNFMNHSLALYLEEHPEIDSSNPAVLAAVKRQIAMGVLLRNPLLSLLVHIKDSMNSFRPGYSEMNLVFFDLEISYGNNVGTGEAPNLSELSPMQLIVFGFATIYYGLLYLGAALGLLLLLWQSQWLKLLLLFALPYWFVLVPSIAGNSRFRVPIEGFMAILASLAIFALWDYLQGRFRKSS
jgi:4-amino-4-deoxy-L-arabinose transferase-like glycosyltransferase